jgi:DNA-binding CsgD family transcriptional regulator
VNNKKKSPTPGAPLSPRERQVLDLVVEGLSNKLIADRLGISEHTAKFFLLRGMAKLNAIGSRTLAAVRWDRQCRALV